MVGFPRPGSPWKPPCCQRWARQCCGNAGDAWRPPRGQSWPPVMAMFRDYPEITILNVKCHWFLFWVKLGSNWRIEWLRDLVQIIGRWLMYTWWIVWGSWLNWVEPSEKSWLLNAFDIILSRFQQPTLGFDQAAAGMGIWARADGECGLWVQQSKPRKRADELTGHSQDQAGFLLDPTLFTQVHQVLEGMGLDWASALIEAKIGCFM